MNICFDIGNVLFRIDFDMFLNKLSAIKNISRADAYHFLERNQGLHDLGITKLQDEFSDHFGIKSDYVISELLTAWDNCLIPDNDAINFVNSLSENLNNNIALVSNIGFNHLNYLINGGYTYGRISNNYLVIDNCCKFFSCNVGARKPSYVYFNTFLNMYPKFHGALYIDDRDDNLETGKLFGFKSVKFDLNHDHVSKLKEIVKEYNVK